MTGFGLHSCEGEQFFAQVFYGCADVIDGIVDKQKTVVKMGRFFYGYGGVLCVMSCKIQL